MRIPSAGPERPRQRPEAVDDAGVLALLYDIYGGLLTPKARRLFELRYHRDLSLAEIAAGERVSRQAVHDVLQRSTRTLSEAERRLGLARRYRRQRAIVDRALEQSSVLVEAARRRVLPAEVACAARAVHRALVALSRQL